MCVELTSLILGKFNVLLLNDSVPNNVASVPVVGNVTVVAPVIVNVLSNTPLVVKLPPSVMVLPLLFTPVPPYWPVMILAFQVPVVIVPILTIPFPKLVASITLMPPMRYSLVATKFKCSERFHALVALLQTIVLSVVPFSVIPPPSAVASVEASTSNVIVPLVFGLLGVTVNVVGFTIVAMTVFPPNAPVPVVFTSRIPTDSMLVSINAPDTKLSLIVADSPVIVDTVPNSIFLSSTLTVVELIVVIAPAKFTLPLTLRSPVRFRFLPTDTLPPIVAPPVVTIRAVSAVLSTVNEPSTVKVDLQTGLVPSLVNKVLAGPIGSLFKILTVLAKSISPVAYELIFVPPRVTGTLLVKLAGFKKYALSNPSSVPASTTPSLINTSPTARPVPT